MKATFQERTLRHRDVTQLASEPAHLPVTDQRPRGQGSRATLGFGAPSPLGGLEGGSHHRRRSSGSLVLHLLAVLPWVSSLVPLCLSFLIWKMRIIVEEHLQREN